jgi:hypothetical protein
MNWSEALLRRGVGRLKLEELLEELLTRGLARDWLECRETV